MSSQFILQLWREGINIKSKTYWFLLHIKMGRNFHLWIGTEKVQKVNENILYSQDKKQKNISVHKTNTEQSNRSKPKQVAWEGTTQISVYIHCEFNCKGFPLSFSLFSLKRKKVSRSFPHSVPQLQPQRRLHVYMPTQNEFFWNNPHMK